MRWQAAQDFIDKVRFSVMNEDKYRAFKKVVRQALGYESLDTVDYADHKVHGKIYYPYYNLYSPMGGSEEYKSSNGLTLYNEFGEKLETFFIRDIHGAHAGTTRSRYIFWDRYDFSHKTHFYTHNSMLETMGKPDKRYGAFVESEAICPDDYLIFEKHKGLEKDFDLIFTYSAKILDSVSNARFSPLNAHIWDIDAIDDLYTKKTKNISILSSSKQMCEIHKFRSDLAHCCKNEGLADTFGTFDGGKFVPKLANVLSDYRYNICIENCMTPYYFTERIINAFVAQTIPIYLGATKIDEFFNPDGIIKFSPKDDIRKILKQCTKEEYEARLPAILDNYHRALKDYSDNAWDNMYKKYLKK